jgi:hypothetical protein
MRVMMSDLFSRWAPGAGLVALVALVCAIVVPHGLFWSAGLAAGLLGAAIATSLVVRSRQAPTLAQVITSATAETATVLARSPAARAASGSAR